MSHEEKNADIMFKINKAKKSNDEIDVTFTKIDQIKNDIKN